MVAQGFGDYSKSDEATREEMRDMALAYEAQRQASPSVLAEAATKRIAAAYEDGTATKRDIIALRSLDAITVDEATAYYEAHGWALPKYGLR